VNPHDIRQIGFRSVEHAGIGKLVRQASFNRKVTIFHKKIQTRKDVDSLKAYLTPLGIPCQKIEVLKTAIREDSKAEVKRNKKPQAIHPGLFFFAM
jgi:hypothetical protein